MKAGGGTCLSKMLILVTVTILAVSQGRDCLGQLPHAPSHPSPTASWDPPFSGGWSPRPPPGRAPLHRATNIYLGDLGPARAPPTRPGRPLGQDLQDISLAPQTHCPGEEGPAVVSR